MSGLGKKAPAYRAAPRHQHLPQQVSYVQAPHKMKRLHGLGAAPLSYGQFGPFVAADAVDRALEAANMADQLGTGLPPQQEVSYRFDADTAWVQRTRDANGHTSDLTNYDSTGALGRALRLAYAQAAGLSTTSGSSTMQQTFTRLVSPTLAKNVDASADVSVLPTGLRVVYALLSAAGTGLGAYHGYNRNRHSIGWGIWWGLVGGLFPIITTTTAFIQGFGKPRRGK